MFCMTGIALGRRMRRHRVRDGGGDTAIRRGLGCSPPSLSAHKTSGPGVASVHACVC